MADMNAKYPVSELFQALDCLKPEFDISDKDELYVDFDGMRSEASFSSLMINLGILKGRLDDSSRHAKILYTGHAGSGKSTELKKLHQKLSGAEKYFSIYFDVEEYIQISKFESEDFLVLLIGSLINALEEKNITYDVAGLRKIADDWLSDKEVTEEVKSRLNNEAGAGLEVSTGGLLKFLSLKANFKTMFSYGTQTSEIVRKKVKEKQGDYIFDLNEALVELKHVIQRTGNGRQIIFIVDGLEKLRWGRYDVYTRTFFQDAALVRELQCSLICCVPIDSLYDSKTSPLSSTYDDHFTLPLIPIKKETQQLFCEIVSKRVNESVFFEEDVLRYCVEQSGGSPRQLIRIVYMAITRAESNNFRVSLENARKVCLKLGTDLWHRLTSVQHEALKSNDLEGADPNILDMLFSLALLTYNGELNRRLPNPLLKPFLPQND